MDRQTSSLWSQISGEGLEGKMKGQILELFPSEFMNFSAVVERYPQAKFLDKPSKGEAGSYYNKYFTDPERVGIFGHTFESEDMGTKTIALGLRIGRDAVALSLDKITKASTAKVELAGQVALVFYDPDSGDSFAYSTTAEKAKSGKLTVESDGSVKFSGKTLTANELRAGVDGFESMPLITTFWFAWKSFFPRTTIGKFWPNS